MPQQWKRRLSIQLKKLVISKKHYEESIINIASQLRLPYGTIYTVIRRGKLNKGSIQAPKYKNTPKLSVHTSSLIMCKINSNRRVTLNNLTTDVVKNYHIKVYPKNINRMLKKKKVLKNVFPEKKPYISEKNKMARIK